MRKATNIARDNLISLGTCLGKFTKSGKFKLHITALDFLAPYAKVTNEFCFNIIVNDYDGDDNVYDDDDDNMVMTVVVMMMIMLIENVIYDMGDVGDELGDRRP